MRPVKRSTGSGILVAMVSFSGEMRFVGGWDCALNLTARTSAMGSWRRTKSEPAKLRVVNQTVSTRVGPRSEMSVRATFVARGVCGWGMGEVGCASGSGVR